MSTSALYAAFYVALYSLAAGVLHVHEATSTPPEAWRDGLTNQAYKAARSSQLALLGTLIYHKDI
jgi:hypothetical protein